MVFFGGDVISASEAPNLVKYFQSPSVQAAIVAEKFPISDVAMYVPLGTCSPPRPSFGFWDVVKFQMFYMDDTYRNDQAFCINQTSKLCIHVDVPDCPWGWTTFPFAHL